MKTKRKNRRTVSAEWIHRLLIAALVTLVALAGSAWAQDVLQSMKVLKPDALTWKANPVLPNGAETAVLVGDPSKPGAFTLYTKFPAHYRVPPHTHPFSEVVTIISGSMGNGMGEKFDPQQGEMLKAGSLLTLPANHAHYVWTGDEGVIVQIEATGPWGITYINPADDPRKKTNSKATQSAGTSVNLADLE